MSMIRHIPNALTALNLLSGSIGIVLVMKGNPLMAAIFILIGALFDFLDGFVARLMKVSSELGKELDSLADMVTFSLLPALLVFGLMEKQFQSPIAYLAFLIAISSAFRLARFNLDSRQKEHFIGMPTPANAFLIVGLIFLLHAGPPQGFYFLNEPAFLLGFVLATSYLLNSPMTFIAFKVSKISLRGNELRIILILASIVFIAIWQLSGLFFVMITYILLSLAGHFLAGKRT